ncbi:hypothetical protein PIIN_08919 [Serendipita indica DSM 11827]|uniref:DUF6533 domain-containing protein n=1 Tax=Serendipita indica (strain DSM 11827) TaxID=1109443 RepID=G4TUE6_SERID|nr:hypothetical protein PIIN_08919 [Serendipita indica DSM 11827]
MSNQAQPGSILAQVEYVIFSLQSITYVSGAAFVVWLWDILLNLDIETSVLWQQNGAFIKVLYSLVRYGPFLVIVPNFLVYMPNHVVTLSNKLYVICIPPYINFMLRKLRKPLYCDGTRTYNLCLGRDLRLRPSCIRTLQEHSLDENAHRFHYSHESPWNLLLHCWSMVWFDPLKVCVALDPPRKALSIMCASSLILEVVIFAATLYHAIRFRRDHSHLGETAAGMVIKTLHKDGFSYFALIFTSRLIICILLWCNTSLAFILLVYIEFSVVSTMTSHWLLSFRQLAMGFWEQPMVTDAGRSTSATITMFPTTTFEVSNGGLSLPSFDPGTAGREQNP